MNSNKVGAIQFCDRQSAEMALRECLERLAPKKRLLIHLRFWEQKTIEEIATTLRASWGDVDKLINEAFRELKAMLLMRPEGRATHADHTTH